MHENPQQHLLAQLERLNAIGIALSAERDSKRLLEMILLGAQEITNADGGTLYTITQDKHLKFEMMRNKSLNMFLGGTTGKEIPFSSLPLYLADGSPNLTTVAAYATLKNKAVNIENVHEVDSFDFSGTRKFDQKTGYHSQSFLTIPMKDHESNVIGVLQLINAIDSNTGNIIPFSIANQTLVESLSSQAAVAMTNHHLIDGLKNLFEAFIELIADAIDQKSPYTGGHCRRVPELTMMLTQAVIDAKTGPFKDFTLNDNELYELKVASWLHDCGKVTTPEAVMDKPTKLSSIFDRIALLDQRFELVKQQAECAMLKKQVEMLKAGGLTHDVSIMLEQQQSELAVFNAYCDEAKVFLKHANVGGESMTTADQQRIQYISKLHVLDPFGHAVPFLNEDEIYNLSIKRGTLTAEERQVINNHIVVTINMLESLPYPQSLARVPEYACGHHEHMDGSGYPKGLTRDQMSIPARVMGIADIFEALTSKDRPYKKAKTLSESLAILGKMKLDNHIDPDLFDIFIREGIYLKYAHAFLEPEQIDAVDLSKVPGYQPESLHIK